MNSCIKVDLLTKIEFCSDIYLEDRHCVEQDEIYAFIGLFSLNWLVTEVVIAIITELTFLMR
jgi:hypothetical protein